MSLPDKASRSDKAASFIDTPPNVRRFLRQWRWWIAPAALALLFAVLFRDPFAGDWDALDYTVLALQPEPSSMLLGRMLFIFTNHFIWRAAHALTGLQAEHAYLLFKYVVIIESPLAVVACWTLARDLTHSLHAATIAATLLVFSPFYVVYSGQAMTEIPSILLLALALIVHLRGLRRHRPALVLAGAVLLGAGVNLREGVALYGLWLAFAPFACGWRFQARELLTTAAACALFFVFALGPFACYYLLDINNYAGKWHGWVESTKMESALHPVSLANFRMLAFWFFVASPLVLLTLPFAMFREWREEGWSPLLLLAATGLFSNLALITHYSMVINGRYLLTGLPALLPLTGRFLLRSRAMHALARALTRTSRSQNETQTKDEYDDLQTGARGATGTNERGGENRKGVFALALALVCAVGLALGWKAYEAAWPTIKSHSMTGEYRARLELLPKDAVVMAGGQTVAVSFWRGVGAGSWEWIGTGGGWPGERLVEVIENHLREGRRVFLDADPRLWSTHGWQLEETRAVARLATRFRFRRISETIYEIRPPHDADARDTPDLQNLLPENRK